MAILTADIYYWFEFQLRLPYAGVGRLLMGQLTLWANSIPSNTWKATSGCAGYQFKGAQSLKGRGPLPATKQIGGAEYNVRTGPLDRRGVRGINGNFYQILPELVQIGPRTRGDFGIHKDMPTDGTAGCIGLCEPNEWIVFESTMLMLNRAKHISIPLKVNYIQA